MIANAIRRILDFIGLVPLKFPIAEVVEIKELSPTMRQIRLGGSFEKLNIVGGSYLSFKLNYTQTRTYTLSTIDTNKGFLEFIVYLHPSVGTGQRFINELRLGDKISMNSLRSNSHYLDLPTSKLVFFGDETSIGLAHALFRKWSVQAIEFLFLFELEEENKSVPEKLGFSNTLVFSKRDTFRQEKLISQLPPIISPLWKDAVFLLTGNAKSIQIFRKVIKDKTTSKVYTRGYWIEGIEGL